MSTAALRRAFSPIAVVGRGCVLPRALDPDTLWQNVQAGVDAVSDVPPWRWGVEPELVAGVVKDSVDLTYSTAGGYVVDFDEVFEPRDLAVDGAGLAALDPLFRWVIHAGRAALEEAGFTTPLAAATGARAGVILGNLSFPTDHMARLGARAYLATRQPWAPGQDLLATTSLGPAAPLDRFMSGLPAHLLGRALGLGATAYCLDAACASSLYAMRFAADLLHSGRADVMLAGAVNRGDSLYLHIGFCALNALSRSGRSRPFHRKADGLIPGEGAAVVALMRLADAVAEGRPILGVIRGLGLSNDGRARNLLAPAADGQVRAMRNAYLGAGFGPETVSMIECHATGTPMGDRTELESMAEVFGERPPRSLPIGSLKSNLGHLITVAGAAGVLKVLGALRAEVRPPTLHVDEPVPRLKRDDTPFRVLHEAEPWPRPEDHPRRAAVNAFGFGGNNAHIVLEAWEGTAPRHGFVAPPAPPLAPPPVVVVRLGARVGAGRSVADFARALFAGRRDGPDPRCASEVAVEARGVRFPPNDLNVALPQQLQVFEAVREAVSDLAAAHLPRERTAVLVGMQCDMEVATAGLRWRIKGWSHEWRERLLHAPLDDEAWEGWVRELRDAIAPPLDPRGVLGQMPNIPANRLNVQLDLGGAGLTVSAEELSGLAALDIALGMLQRGEMDTVIVGATEMACDFRDEAALEAARQGEDGPPPGDAAVALVLMRQDDATARGLTPLAVLDGLQLASGDRPLPEAEGGGRLLRFGIGPLGTASPGLDLAARFGHAHTASGLLHVAASVLAVHHGLLPSGFAPAKKGGPLPWLVDEDAPRRAQLEVEALGGARGRITITAPTQPNPRPQPVLSGVTATPHLLTLGAASAAELRQAIAALVEAENGALRTALDTPPRRRPWPRARLAVLADDLPTLRSRLNAAAQRLTEDGEGDAEEAGPEGVFLGRGPAVEQEEVAFVFGAINNLIPGTGRELLCALPTLTADLGKCLPALAHAFRPALLYPSPLDLPTSAPTYLDQLFAASCLSQLHARFTHGLLDILPGAGIGYSLGESNALFALGAWDDLGGMVATLEASPLFTRALAGPYETVRDTLRQAGQAVDDEEEVWQTVTVVAPVAAVRTAAEDEPFAFLTIINSAEECVIAGLPAAVERVVNRLDCLAVPVPLAPAVHCPLIEPLAETYRQLHTRPTRRPAGIRFYAHADCAPYEVGVDACAEALLGQARTTVDFPALIERAYEDGVRVFIEHGPRGLCSGWIGRILAGRHHHAIPIDRAGRSSLTQAVTAAAQLFAVGVELDLSPLLTALDRLRPAVLAPSPTLLHQPAHRSFGPLPPPPTPPDVEATATAAAQEETQAVETPEQTEPTVVLETAEPTATPEEAEAVAAVEVAETAAAQEEPEAVAAQEEPEAVATPEEAAREETETVPPAPVLQTMPPAPRLAPILAPPMPQPPAAPSAPAPGSAQTEAQPPKPEPPALQPPEPASSAHASSSPAPAPPATRPEIVPPTPPAAGQRRASGIFALRFQSPARRPQGSADEAPDLIPGLQQAFRDQRHDFITAHRTYYEQQSKAHQAFMEMRRNLTARLAAAAAGDAVAATPAVPGPPPKPAPPEPEAPAPPAPEPSTPEPPPPPEPVEVEAAAAPVVETPTPVTPASPQETEETLETEETQEASELKVETLEAEEARDAEETAESEPAAEPATDKTTDETEVSEPASEEPRPLYDRADLERLATGPISAVFGPRFAQQDHFRRQVRMPAPPLLLCDRVLSINAEPGVLATGTSLCTESDITWDSWYLHQGHIPPGVLIETGQADLLLISYMGVDFENRGERLYRLLGCDVTFHRPLPPAGSRLHHDIHIDDFAVMGRTRIFFFHFTCRLGGPEGELVLTMRNGQAGFFSDEELATSGGVLWDPEQEDPATFGPPPVAPRVMPTARVLSRADLEALASGAVGACFGHGFEATSCHVRTPTLPGGDLLLLDRVTDLDPGGGPWGRGYLRAELSLSPDSWFFHGHFKDDPCMPGTIMFEGCLQCLDLYLIALGFTIDRDGWRFEPRKEACFALRCRGQATPSSQKLVYEVFVKSLRDRGQPVVQADILVTVDGRKALICHDVAVELVVGWPLESEPELLGLRPRSSTWDAVGGIGVAADESAKWGQAQLLAAAWGQPSAAFGPSFARFDDGRHVARLPGPPYHFMSRVHRVEGPPQNAFAAGMVAFAAYDVPPDAWYFTAGGNRAMPFAVLLEVALQSCGWLSAYSGCPLRDDASLYFRNLDGRGRVQATVRPDIGTLDIRTEMTRISRSSGMIIVAFEVAISASGRPVFDASTIFGYFPADALIRQAGVPTTDAERERMAEPSPPRADGGTFPVDLRGFSPFGTSLQLPGGQLLMIDRITGYWPEGGSRGLGRVRAEKTVDPDDWFFRAHFFGDSVQPGSLGIEAMIQAGWWLMIESGVADGLAKPRFIPLAEGGTVAWKYRGQVLPTAIKIEVELDVLDRLGTTLIAEAWLWVDGLRIYHAPQLALCIAAGS